MGMESLKDDSVLDYISMQNVGNWELVNPKTNQVLEFVR